MNVNPTNFFLFLCAFVFCSYASFSQDFRFGKVSKKELLEESHPSYPDAEAAILYREVKTSVEYNKEKGFVAVSEIFERVKIYNAKGFDWGTVEVSLYTPSSAKNRETLSGLKAYTYTIKSDKIEEVKLANSAIFEEKKSKYRVVKKFTMPTLEEGCIIEYRYKIKSPFLTDINAFVFQESIPVNKAMIRFLAPEYFSYNEYRRGWIPFDIVTSRKDKTITSLQSNTSATGFGALVNSAGKSQIKFSQNISEVNLNNVPPLIEEAFAGNMENYASSLKYELGFVDFPNSIPETFSSDWGSVSNTIYQANSFGDQLARTGYFENELDQFLNGATDASEKLARVFEFVKGKMNWNGYVGIYTDEGVKKSFEAGSGNTADINLMLTTMFRYVGFKANPVLISTKSNGLPIFPTINGFNYVISAVETEEGTLLFDATNKYATPNILSKELLNWQGRIVREDESSNWVSLSPSKLAVEAFMVNATMNSDGTILGSLKNQFTGNRAFENRTDFMGLGVEDIEKELENRYEQLNVSGTKFENLENPYQSLKIDFNFETQNFVEDINGNLYLSPLMFLTMDENPFNLEDRKFPVDYGYPSKKRYIVSIYLPEGYRVESLPAGANVKMGDNVVSFKYLLSEKNNKIQLSAEFSINRHLVGPQQYGDLKKFYQYMIDKEKEKIVLSKI